MTPEERAEALIDRHSDLKIYWPQLVNAFRAAHAEALEEAARIVLEHEVKEEEMRYYTIQAFHQPKPGHGWEPCDRNHPEARFFVYSGQESVRGDRLHGRDFPTLEAAEDAIDGALETCKSQD